jgi:hypothetical protein
MSTSASWSKAKSQKRLSVRDEASTYLAGAIIDALQSHEVNVVVLVRHNTWNIAENKQLDMSVFSCH